MIVVNFDGTKATLEGGTWQGEDADFVELLNTWTQTNIETAITPDDPFFDLHSPSNPYPDYTIAQAAAAAWEGEIIEMDEPGEIDEEAVY